MASIVATACTELTIHAGIEEDIFYPAVREAIDDEDLLDEAEVEHATAKDLIAELADMEPTDQLYAAKFTVLGEYVDHHVKEEQDEMFPKVKKSGLDLAALGEELAQRQEELRVGMGFTGDAGEEEDEAPSRSSRTGRNGSGGKRKERPATHTMNSGPKVLVPSGGPRAPRAPHEAASAPRPSTSSAGSRYGGTIAPRGYSGPDRLLADQHRDSVGLPALRIAERASVDLRRGHSGIDQRVANHPDTARAGPVESNTQRRIPIDVVRDSRRLAAVGTLNCVTVDVERVVLVRGPAVKAGGALGANGSSCTWRPYRADRSRWAGGTFHRHARRASRACWTALTD